uniref:Lipoprotein n=1 Tax=Caenorhabditis japonica TaxID=281687 RepID=A0A8R1IH74_CAEJA
MRLRRVATISLVCVSSIISCRFDHHRSDQAVDFLAIAVFAHPAPPTGEEVKADLIARHCRLTASAAFIQKKADFEAHHGAAPSF